jgi:hypothetical protein
MGITVIKGTKEIKEIKEIKEMEKTNNDFECGV